MQYGDLIGDIAVLGMPDGEVFPEEAQAFRELIDVITPLDVGKAPAGPGNAETRSPRGSSSERSSPMRPATRGCCRSTVDG